MSGTPEVMSGWSRSRGLPSQPRGVAAAVGRRADAGHGKSPGTRERSSMTHDSIQMSERGEEPAAVVRGHATAAELPAFLGGAFGEVMEQLGAQQVGPAGPPFGRYRPTDGGVRRRGRVPGHRRGVRGRAGRSLRATRWRRRHDRASRRLHRARAGLLRYRGVAGRTRVRRYGDAVGGLPRRPGRPGAADADQLPVRADLTPWPPARPPCRAARRVTGKVCRSAAPAGRHAHSKRPGLAVLLRSCAATDEARPSSSPGRSCAR